MRGRRPTPTVLKILRGNPGKRALPKDEPKPEAYCGDPPAILTDEALAEWRRIFPVLDRLGLVTAADVAVLAAYCQAWARWVEAEKQVTKYGAVVQKGMKKDAAGNVLQAGAPCLSAFAVASNMAMRQFLDAASRLGLEPSSRTRLKTTAGRDNLEWGVKRGSG